MQRVPAGLCNAAACCVHRTVQHALNIIRIRAQLVPPLPRLLCSLLRMRPASQQTQAQQAVTTPLQPCSSRLPSQRPAVRSRRQVPLMRHRCPTLGRAAAAGRPEAGLQQGWAGLVALAEWVDWAEWEDLAAWAAWAAWTQLRWSR